MKNKILIIGIFAFLFSAISFSQTYLLPAQGDRFSFYLNAGVWQSYMTYDSHFSIYVYQGYEYENDRSVYILNINLNQDKAKKLKEYINSHGYIVLDEHHYDNGKLDRFSVYSNPNPSDTLSAITPTKNKVDVFDLMAKIRTWEEKP